MQDDEQLWADALAERVLNGSLKPGALPRGLSTQLGWTASKTHDVSERARLKMVAFVQERASGRVCADRQALLQRFIATDTSRDDGQRPALDLKRYMAVLLHVGGCHECSLAWRERHRKFLGPVPGVLALPFGAVAWAKRVLHELASSVDIATLSVRQRLGLGGGASVVTGGGAATLATKTATVCAAAACAVGAGSEVVILAPIAPNPVHQTARKHPARHHASREHARPVVTPTRSRVTTPAPAPPTRPAAQATSVADTPVAPEQDFTPGDLPPASSTSAGSSSKHSLGEGSSAPGDLPSASATPPAPPPPAGADGAHCVLGDLEC
ncbi:MAG: hypothetical protein LC777_00315 [Actinobacteria bacterium]|nr:hypothetical protein [Actinomycetota bacterium]